MSGTASTEQSSVGQTPAEAGAGLSEADARARLAAMGRRAAPATSRSYASIVRANVLTVFNLILAVFGAVTLLFGDPRDALFLGVIVANSAIGIAQEVRAKRALDRLALLVAPRARALRDGVPREVAVEEVVPGDVLEIGPGDQVLADGTLLRAQDLELDESVLTGESEPVARAAGQEIRSGAFVTEGSGALLVAAVGEQSFAARLVGEARSFRHPRSPLELAVNRLLYALVIVMLLLGAVLGFSIYHRHIPRHEAVSTAVAGVVSLVPEGLIVLVSLTYAVAAARMARRGVLAQQLNAIESLASVEVLCVDKTGTLTEAALRVAGVEPAEGCPLSETQVALGRMAACASTRNGTIDALAAEFPGEPEAVVAEVPFSARRRWSAVTLADGTWLLGAPERFALGGLSARASALASEGRRVLALAHSEQAPGSLGPEDPPPPASVLALVILAERLRESTRETIAFLRGEGVEVKVLSGDAPATVAAIAGDAGIAVARVADGSEVPDDAAELAAFAREVNVVGRISPEGKRAIVRALTDDGRYVAMIGDGVNDVPALKAARLAIAQGTGTQMARSISDLVLVSGEFGAVPPLVHEGRKSLRNLQRVTKLYVTKSAFAAFLILTIGTTSEAYPLLPRHLSLVAALAIGIPTFFLALAPSSGPWGVEGFASAVARYAVPAGTLLGTATVAGYLFALHDLDYSVPEARTIAATVLLALGLYLVIALESAQSLRRSSLVTGMCAVMAGAYAAILLVPATRTFFQLIRPTAGMLATSLVAAGLGIGALWLAGYQPGIGAVWARTRPPEGDGGGVG